MLLLGFGQLLHSPVVYGGVTRYQNQPARFNGLTIDQIAGRTLKRPLILIVILPRRERRGYASEKVKTTLILTVDEHA